MYRYEFLFFAEYFKRLIAYKNEPSLTEFNKLNSDLTSDICTDLWLSGIIEQLIESAKKQLQESKTETFVKFKGHLKPGWFTMKFQPLHDLCEDFEKFRNICDLDAAHQEHFTAFLKKHSE